MLYNNSFPSLDSTKTNIMSIFDKNEFQPVTWTIIKKDVLSLNKHLWS